jgi:hypothetical protein
MVLRNINCNDYATFLLQTQECPKVFIEMSLCITERTIALNF